MLDLLKDIFSYFVEFSYKFINSQSSVLLFIAMIVYSLSYISKRIGRDLLEGDNNDNINS